MSVLKPKIRAIHTNELPFKVKKSDLNANGKLFDEQKILELEKICTEDNKKYSKKSLHTKFSVIKTADGRLCAIYSGEKNKLGAGGFGKAQLMQDLKTGEWLVLKTVTNKNLAISPKELSKTELENLQKMGVGVGNVIHYTVSKSIDGITKDVEKAHFAMELASGSSLNNWIHQSASKTMIERLDAAIAVGEALAEVHAKGLTHNDIKPENIIYDPATKKAKVIDLGLAKNSTEVFTGGIAGTLGYIPPEIMPPTNPKSVANIGGYVVDIPQPHPPVNLPEGYGNAVIPLDLKVDAPEGYGKVVDPLDFKANKPEVKIYHQEIDIYALGKTFDEIFGLSELKMINGELHWSDKKTQDELAELEKDIQSLTKKMTAENPEERAKLPEIIENLKQKREALLLKQKELNLPKKVDPQDLQANNKLLSEQQIKEVKEKLSGRDNFKYSKKESKLPYSVISINGSLYALYKTIGKGAFGKVQLMQNLEDGSWSALKVQKRERVDDSKYQGIEAQNLKELNMGLNETPIAYLGEKGEKAFIGMKLAKGVPLSDWMFKPHSASELIKASIAVLKAIKQFHQQGFIHRDIKPENILYDAATGIATIIDVGFSIKKDQQDWVSCGTMGYYAPELKKGSPYYDEKTDLFAVGKTLQEMFQLIEFNEREKEWQENNPALANPELKVMGSKLETLKKTLESMTHEDPKKRPKTEKVLEQCEKIDQVLQFKTSNIGFVLLSELEGKSEKEISKMLEPLSFMKGVYIVVDTANPDYANIGSLQAKFSAKNIPVLNVLEVMQDKCEKTEALNLAKNWHLAQSNHRSEFDRFYYVGDQKVETDKFCHITLSQNKFTILRNQHYRKQIDNYDPDIKLNSKQSEQIQEEPGIKMKFKEIANKFLETDLAFQIQKFFLGKP